MHPTTQYVPQPVTPFGPLLAVAAAALLLWFIYAVVRRQLTGSKVKNRPLTPAETLSKFPPQDQLIEPVRLRLTSIGRIAMIFCVVIGVVWIGVTGLVIHAFAADGPNLPLLIPVAFLTLLVTIPARNLRRDFVLFKKGRLTAGIVVGVLSGRRSAWTIYYDFLNDQGEVLRGRSIYNSNSYNPGLGAGSPTFVLYRPDYPQCSALKLCMCWEEQ